jgi:murein DD-endopeptidase MepM/ murein hydrolase activator NlpD
MRNSRRFNLISWGVTALVVVSLLGTTYWRLSAETASAQTLPSVDPAEGQQEVASNALPAINSAVGEQAVRRTLKLKTIIPQRPRYGIVKRTVERGDSISALAKEFTIKPETLLWANADTLEYGPDSLRIGQVLSIPPTDGVFYQWKDTDTLDKVANEFKADPENILTWPGNDLDLTDPVIKAGQWLMIPGGTGVFNYQTVETATRGQADDHFLSGNDFYSGHPGIDISDTEGQPVYAADNGVVTMAQGGWNYGYGNVVQIDHGNGTVTLYAHLSQINVTQCQSVYGGQLIGLAGNTGNSFGAHLHFEVRLNGKQVNPWNYLPAP